MSINDETSLSEARLVEKVDDGPKPRSDRDALDLSHLGRTWQIVLIVVLVVQMIVLGFLYVPIPPNPDHELYDYLAWTSIEKGGLYRNAGDVNMPGEAILHIASMKLFGNHFWSYRMLEYLVLVGFLACVSLLICRDYGKTFACFFFGFYPIVYTTAGYWMTGQRDLLATHAIVLAGFTYLQRARGRGIAWLIPTGLAMTSAVLLKPTYLAFGALLLFFALILMRTGLKQLILDAIVLALVGAIAIGSLFLLGYATDSLRAWHEMTIVYSLNNYVGGREVRAIIQSIFDSISTSWQWYIVMAMVGLISLLLERRKALLTVVLATIATVILSTFAQRKGFGYHFGGLLVVISLLSAAYMTEMVRGARKISDLRLRTTVLMFPAFLLFGGLLSKCYKEFKPQIAWYLDRSRFDDLLQSRNFKDVFDASNYVRSATSPGQTVWTFGSHMMINTLAGRPSPTRLVNPVFLRTKQASPIGEAWRLEVQAIFREAPPEFIVLEAANPPKFDVYNFMSQIRADEPISEFKDALDEFYTFDRRIGRFVFFRKDDTKYAASKIARETGTTAKPN